MKRLNSIFEKSLVLVPPVFAQETQTITFGGWQGLEDIRLAGIVAAVIQFALIAAAIIAFFFLIFGGIKWITSGGDKEATAGAQSMITAAVIGLAIVFAVWAVMALIETFFGISILGGVTIPTIS